MHTARHMAILACPDQEVLFWGPCFFFFSSEDKFLWCNGNIVTVARCFYLLWWPVVSGNLAVQGREFNKFRLSMHWFIYLELVHIHINFNYVDVIILIVCIIVFKNILEKKIFPQRTMLSFLKSRKVYPTVDATTMYVYLQWWPHWIMGYLQSQL